MKKIILLFAASVSLMSCNDSKAPEAKNFKTAYIDTAKLLDESTEAKDIKEKYKAKAAEFDGKIKNEATQLENEQRNFSSNAQKNGQAWAQQKYGELQQRDQMLQYKQQGMLRQLQEESGNEMEALVKKYKQVFKDYGKEKGYDYIYGTGESATVLYAKDNYDITQEIIDLVNEKYKSGEDKTEAKKEDKKK